MVTPYSIFMPQAQTIENFKQAILGRSGGISASNLYSFFIAAPSLPPVGQGYSLRDHFDRNFTGGLGWDQAQNFQLNMQCNEIQVPGVTMSASDYKMAHKGIIQKVASSKVFNELDVSFYCDADSIPYKFFRTWQDYIIGGIEKPRDMYAGDHSMANTLHKAYAQRYYDYYTCDLVINKMEKHGVEKPADPNKDKEDYRIGFQVKLTKAYPYTVSSIPYSAGPAQLVKVTVGLYYEYSHLITG